MKLLNAVAVTVLSLTFGANAFAQTSTSGLTRADVTAQLKQAQAEGLVPSHDEEYPPTDAEIARNRELYAIGHRADNTATVRAAQMPSMNDESVSN